MEYILGPKPDSCVFCIPEHAPDHPGEDRDRLVLARAEHCFVIMNKFPYNSGHLMICPNRHVSCLTELSPLESVEMMAALTVCTDIVRKAFRPQGINIGLNLGEAAGAGIATHLHFQLVPRWNGDNSFMAVFGQTHVIPELLLETYDRIKPRFIGAEPFRNI
jgi:ATP adenylyltransferase